MNKKYCINGTSQYHALMWMNSTKIKKFITVKCVLLQMLWLKMKF